MFSGSLSLAQPESVGGFKLVHVVMETGQEDTFVFHARSRLKGGSTTTVSSKQLSHNVVTWVFDDMI